MAESLTIQIKGDTKNFQKAMTDLEKSTADLQNKLSDIASKASVAFAGLSATVTGLISAYRTQEQAEIKLATAIKSTGGAAGLTKKELLDMASSLQQVSTFGDEAIIEAQALLLTFTKIGEDVFPQATETILNMSAAMGTDLKSSTIMLGKALNDPIAGVTALSRAGVQLTETQKEQIKSFDELGNVAQAQKIILQELEVQFGGQARATAKGTGAFIQLSNTIGDLAEKIGKHLVPPLASVAKFLDEAFGQVLKDKNETLAKTVAQVLLFGVNLTGLTAGAALATKALLALRLAFLTAGGAAKGFNKALKGSLIGLALTGAAVALTKFMDNFTANMEKAGRILKAFGVAIMRTLGGPFLIFTEGIKKIPELLTLAMMGSFDLVKKQVLEFKNLVIAASNLIVDGLKEFGLSIVSESKKTADKLKDVAIKQSESLQDQRAMAFENQMAQRAEFQRLLLEKMGEEFTEQMELTGENDEIMALYNEEQREKLLERLSEFQLTKEELERQEFEKKLKEDIKRKNDELKFEQKHKTKLIGMQKTYYDTMKLLDSKRLKEAGSFASQFNAMADSKNKELRAIAKIAANVQIVSNTAAAASSAMAGSVKFFGIPAGPVIGAVLAAAQIAFGAEQLHRLNAQKLADGGIVEGGLQGVDSVPAMLMPGELVIPKRNAEDALNAIGASRDEEIFGATEGGNQEIIIGFDGEEASQVLTARQIENQALGISREEVA